MIDYHLHTKLCKHAKGEVFEYVESAIDKGLTEDDRVILTNISGASPGMKLRLVEKEAGV